MHNLNRHVREYFTRMTATSISVPRCNACSTHFLPPRALCPTCGSAELSWEECTRPDATVYSLTRMANGKTIALAELGVVDGPGRLYVEVVGSQAEQIQIGERVSISTQEQEFELGDRVPVIVAGGSEE